MSKAHDIALALTARLATITKANGYATDIGLRVFRGKRRLDDEDIPACVVLEGEETITSRVRGGAVVEQQYLLEGHAECDTNNPNDRAHEILADLKRAIFSGDAKLGGLSHDLAYAGRLIGPREDGVPLVFARIAITVKFPEDLTNP